MPDIEDRILDSVSESEFPLLSKLLKTEARPFLLRELRRLISRRWSDRAERSDVDVLARLRGCGMDQAVFVRNISDSGVLLEVEFPKGLRDDGEPLRLLLRTDDGLIEIAMRLARVKPGGDMRQVAFEFAADSGSVAVDELRNLFFGGQATG